MLRIMQQLDELEEEKEHSEGKRNYLAVMVTRLMLRELCMNGQSHMHGQSRGSRRCYCIFPQVLSGKTSG